MTHYTSARIVTSIRAVKIAVVHYHLRKGGVTRVIETAAAALEPHGDELVVASGAPCESEALSQWVEIPALAYRESGTAEEGAALAAELQAKIGDTLGGPPDLWHIHNHALGKNVIFPAALRALIDFGARVLLQIHDFAEDGRPGNYESQRAALPSLPLYPSGPHLHYATLNQRDLSRLRHAGIPTNTLHLLPNAVASPPVEPPPEPPFPNARRFALYPTRGIRRKNIGEVLMLSLLAGPGTTFATTLGPANPAWKPVHERWERLVTEHRLPVHLAWCERGPASFGQLIHEADVIVTTSIAEGFGLAFLEPWLAEKTVVGRNLPEITSDFAIDGVPLDQLYHRLDIPGNWVDQKALRRELESQLSSAWAAYGRSPSGADFEAAWNVMVRENRIDFGCLPERFQESAVSFGLHHPPQLDDVTQPSFDPLPPAEIDRARLLVADLYGLEGYGQRLHGIYRQIVDAPAGDVDWLDPERVLDQFLNPASFHLLRT